MRLFTKLFTVVFFFVAGAAFAEENKSFGTIDNLHFSENKIVISDQTYVFSNSVKIRNQKGNPITKSNLRLGSKILYSSKKHTVFVIDVLPASAKAEDFDSDEE